MGRPDSGLERWIDWAHPIFYLSFGELTREVMVRRVGPDYLIVDLSDDLRALDRVHGFLVAKDGKGTIPIECRVAGGTVDHEKHDVITLRFDPEQLKLVDSREFFRLAPATGEKADLVSTDGRKHRVDLINISAGGVGIVSGEELRSDQIYEITFPLWNTGATLTLAIKVVHCKERRSRPAGRYYGTQFVKDASLTRFPVLTDRIQREIIQSLNRQLLELRKVKED